MVENSSAASFYAHNAVRRIDPAAELKRVNAAGLIADFDGARVCVIGAGLLSGDAKARNAYRDPMTMAALKQFWILYFQQSNATVQEFGVPAFLSRTASIGKGSLSGRFVHFERMQMKRRRC